MGAAADHDLKRFLKPYYVLNVLTLASYGLFRLWFYTTAAPGGHRDMTLRGWESHCVAMLGVSLLLKFVRRTTLDGFFADAFMYCKAVLGVLSFVMDPRVFALYVFAFTNLFVWTAQPVYDGPKKVAYLTPRELDEKVLKSKAKNGYWLVEFFASWAPPCVHLEPVIAELSMEYSTETLRFAKVDLGRWPNLGYAHKIEVAATSHQLPTLIMFHDGKEVARIPHIFKDGSVAKGRYRKVDIVKGFDLDAIWKRTTAAAITKGSTKAGSGAKGASGSGSDKKET